MNDIAIVIQGPSDYVIKQKQAWEDFREHCIFSTWKGSQTKYESSDNVVFNALPTFSGAGNLNYQMHTTLQGLKVAKSMGYNRALKIRSDLVPNNAKKFLEVINNQKLNFLCWHAHKVHPKFSGYLVDYLMSGDIDQLIRLWDIKVSLCNVAQIMLTYNCIKYCDYSNITYFLTSLTDNNNLFWLKKGITLKSYQEFSNYKQNYQESQFIMGQNSL